MAKKSLKQELISCINSYIKNGYIKIMKQSNTPKISIYYMLGYLNFHLTKKDKQELNKILGSDIL